MSERRTDTPALGVQTLHAIRDIDNADPDSQEAATQLVRAEQRAEHRTSQRGRDISQWLLGAFGAVVVILTAWWGMSQLFAERPTTIQVEKLLDRRAQHPDSKAQLSVHQTVIHSMQNQLGRIEEGIGYIKESINELKDDKR